MMDQAIDMTFAVHVQTYGSPEEAVDRIGKRLAKVITLAFGEKVVVEAGDTTYTWSPFDHDGGVH
jgi:hypothetical protein